MATNVCRGRDRVRDPCGARLGPDKLRHTPWLEWPAMESATTFQFARAARALAGEARRLGLVPPSFRCPPRPSRCEPDAPPPGSSVRSRAAPRPAWVAVLGDLVEGIVVANGLVGVEADRIRGAALWCRRRRARSR